MIKYKITVKVSNGYSCSCCRAVWNNSKIIDCGLDEISARKKSNHNIALLEEDMFLLGYETVKSLNSGEELTYGHLVSYTFFNEEIEDDVEIIWSNPFNLKSRWENFIKEWKVEKERKDKVNEIRRLEEKLRKLKS